MTLRDLTGGCHCGNLKVGLQWPVEVPILGRRCSCSFCTSHGGVWSSHEKAHLEVAVSDDELLNRYRFGTATADFLICARCGVPVAAISEIDGRVYGVVNLNSLRGLGDDDRSEAPTDFEGEEVGDRLERRQRNWIADVVVASTQDSPD